MLDNHDGLFGFCFSVRTTVLLVLDFDDDVGLGLRLGLLADVGVLLIVIIEVGQMRVVLVVVAWPLRV